MTGALRFAVVGIVWGTSYFWETMILGAVSPQQISTLRGVVGALALVAVAVATGVSQPLGHRVWVPLLVAGVFLNVLSTVAYLIPDSAGAGAGVVVVINTSVPLWALLFHRWSGGPRTDARIVAGVVGASVGILMMFVPGTSPEQWFSWGAAVSLVAAMAYGYGMVLIHRLTRSGAISPLVASVVVVTSGLAFAAASIPFGGWGPAPQWSAMVVAVIAVLGLLNTALAYTLFIRMIHDDGPVRAGAVLFVVPVIVMAALVSAGVPLVPVQVAGLVLVLAGTVLACVARERPPTPSTPRTEEVLTSQIGSSA